MTTPANPPADDYATLVDQDRDCRVYWGHAGCRLPRGHEGGHVAASGSTPHPGLMFGEDTTPDERADMA